MTFTLAYDPLDEAAVIADAQFEDNAVIYGKRTLDNGDLRFYDMRISSQTESFVFGDEVARTYTFEVDAKYVDNS